MAEMSKRITRHDTEGTCSRQITIRLKDGVIEDVRFEGGCTGNLQGVAALVRGRKADEVAVLLAGIQCRNGTSCPDQLAQALRSGASAVKVAKRQAASKSKRAPRR